MDGEWLRPSRISAGGWWRAATLLAAGGSVGGIVGALVAPPLLGASRVLAVEVLALLLRDRLGADGAAGTRAGA